MVGWTCSAALLVRSDVPSVLSIPASSPLVCPFHECPSMLWFSSSNEISILISHLSSSGYVWLPLRKDYSVLYSNSSNCCPLSSLKNTPVWQSLSWSTKLFHPSSSRSPRGNPHTVLRPPRWPGSVPFSCRGHSLRAPSGTPTSSCFFFLQCGS